MQNQVRQITGNIDIYLFDQLLKGTYDHCAKILDVGCGSGRNLVYFLQNGYDVYGVDPNPGAVAAVTQIAQSLASRLPSGNFFVATAEDMPFGDATFDLTICSAVLHFAQSESHFDAMLRSVWRVIKPGGYFFARLASDIGIENLVQPVSNGRYLLPDGSERFLVNQQMLLQYTNELRGYLHEPIKTTNVQNLRCMTTWCMQKR